MPDGSGYPFTLFDTTFTEADFEGTNYVTGLPLAFSKFGQHAAALYLATSTDAVDIGVGIKNFTVDPGKPWAVGTPLRVASRANPTTKFMDAVVTAYNATTGALTVNAVGAVGSGSANDWNISAGGGGYALSGALGVTQGGTGASDAAGARANLGLGPAAALALYDPAADAATNSGRLVAATADKKLPVIDGSNLTNVVAASVTGIDLSKLLHTDAAGTITAAGPASVAAGNAGWQLTINSGGNTFAGIKLVRQVAGGGTIANALSIDTDAFLATDQGFKTVGAKPISAGSYLQFGGLTGNTIQASGGTYGSAEMSGSKGGYAGIRFPAASHILMMSPTVAGIWNESTAGWEFYWQNATLQTGSVPRARIPDLSGASVNFANSAGSAPAAGGSATYAQYAAGNIFYFSGGVYITSYPNPYGVGYNFRIGGLGTASTVVDFGYSPPGTPGGTSGSSCFLAGTMVCMLDGSHRRIEDVKVGDVLRGRGTEVNAVLMLNRPTLGKRKLLRINGVGVSPEHLFFTTEGPAVYDLDGYRRETNRVQPVEFQDGTAGFKIYKGLDVSKVRQLQVGDRIIGERGATVEVASLLEEDFPEDTPLYNLVLDHSHSYLAGGMLCGGWERDDDFDYDRWDYRR